MQFGDFFAVNSLDISKANCNICNSCVSRGGKEAKSYSTTNLISHLKNKHVSEFAQFNKAKSTHAMKRSPSASPSATFQPTITDVLDRSAVWDFNDPRALSWNKLIGEMICVDVQPFTVVENIGFRRVMAKAEKRYKLPSPNFLQHR